LMVCKVGVAGSPPAASFTPCLNQPVRDGTWKGLC
jgi:hypothetical protein